MKKGELTHAMQWEADPAIAQVRGHLTEMINDPLRSAPDGWGFGLMRRPHPDPFFRKNAVVGYVTLTESGCLTHAMIRALPSPLYLHAGKTQIEILPITSERTVDDEPTPGVLIKILAHAGREVGCVTAMSALDLDPCLLFSTELQSPATGWPV